MKEQKRNYMMMIMDFVIYVIIGSEITRGNIVTIVDNSYVLNVTRKTLLTMAVVLATLIKVAVKIVW